MTDFCETCGKKLDKKKGQKKFCCRKCFSKSQLIDLTGQRFGRLTVIKKLDYSYTGHSIMWLCQCDCGNTIEVSGNNLKNNHTQSCGCKQKEITIKRNTTHNLTKDNRRLHAVWDKIKQRCYNSNNPSYKDYGGRGIIMCDEWRNDFKVFYDWSIANGYDKLALKGECTIDRIDNNKGYSPNNCRWVTNKEQQRNKRTNKFYTLNNKTYCLKEWARMYNMNYQLVWGRVKRGWDIEKALTAQKRITNRTK